MFFINFHEKNEIFLEPITNLLHKRERKLKRQPRFDEYFKKGGEKPALSTLKKLIHFIEFRSSEKIEPPEQV